MTTFSVTGALALADDTLSRPPAKPWIERIPGRGALVARFVLPLQLCLPQNRTRHAISWMHAKRKKAVRRMLDVQCFAQGQRPRDVALCGRDGFSPGSTISS